MPQYVSRGTLIDTDKCVKLSGGNRFNLVIMAAARSRELRRHNRESNRFEDVHTNVTALLEFQDGTTDGTYMKKIKFNDPQDRRRDREARYNQR